MGPVPIYGISSLVLVLSSIEILVLNANSLDPDKTPRSVASNQGQHCLPISLLWDARHKWVKNRTLLEGIWCTRRQIGKHKGCLPCKNDRSSTKLNQSL